MATDALLAIGWLAAVAAAQVGDPAQSGVAVARVDGRLVPGTTNRIEVGVVGAVEPPAVSTTWGPVRAVRQAATGVWEYAVPVPADAYEVALDVATDDRTVPVTLPVWVPAESLLELPRRIDGIARGGDVVIEVRGEDLPRPEALQVALAEGSVVAVEPAEGALKITVRPDDSPFPRHVLVGVRDARRDERPTWGVIRLRARPTLPLESEPGSRVTVKVGDRTYGPMVVGPSGVEQVRVDQFPEEYVATAILVDDLGNETRTEIPLARAVASQLVVFPGGELLPGDPAPPLYVAALQPSGFPWSGEAPQCRTAAADLGVRELSRGQWLVALPPAPAEGADDRRVDCELGRDVTARTRVPVARGVASRLELRVWPQDLRTDFPFAEVRVVLEDHRGERLPVDRVALEADLGTVDVVRPSATEIEADYDGAAASVAGLDQVRARWSAPADGVVPDVVRLGWDDLPREGSVALVARVFDARRRPVPGASVSLSAGGPPVQVVAGPDGVARAVLPVPDGTGPVVLVGSAGGHVAEAVAMRGRAGRPLPPADLDAHADVVLRPGRVAALSVRVDPQVLRAAPGAVAWIYVDVEDHAGNPLDDAVVRVTATEGAVGELRTRPDGTLIAEYVPEPSERPRDVEITAEVDAVRSATRLTIAPGPVRVTLGAWAGMQTNFGSVTAPVVGVDGDIRVRSPLIGESLMLRLGLARYRFSAEVPTGLGALARLSSTVVPVTGAVLYRRDAGRFGAWGGVGGVVGVQDLAVEFGAVPVGRGVNVLGGPTLVGGAGVRLLGGEALVALQGTWLPVDAGEAGFSGNVGGLAGGLGYRLVF